MSDFSKGDRVILARIANERLRGQVGTIKRVIKTEKMALVYLDCGESYRARQSNIDLLPTEGEANA